MDPGFRWNFDLHVQFPMGSDPDYMEKVVRIQREKQAPPPTVVLCAGSQCGHIELASDSDDLVHFCESCYDVVYSSAEGAADEIYW